MRKLLLHNFTFLAPVKYSGNITNSIFANIKENNKLNFWESCRILVVLQVECVKFGCCADDLAPNLTDYQLETNLFWKFISSNIKKADNSILRLSLHVDNIMYGKFNGNKISQMQFYDVTGDSVTKMLNFLLVQIFWIVIKSLTSLPLGYYFFISS